MFDFIAQVAEPVINGLDVVKAVDAFYQNAWVKLVGMFVVFGIVIGIVVPFVIQHIQSSTFDKAEKRLKDDIERIKNETQESIQAEIKTLSDRFGEMQKNLENQIDKTARSNRAEFYCQLATNFSLAVEQKPMAFLFYTYAAEEFATLKTYENLTYALNQAISESEGVFHLLSKISTAETKEKIKEHQKWFLERIDAISKILQKQNVISTFSEQLAKLREICENLTTVT